MASNRVYMIRLPDKRVAITYDHDEAIRAAKKHKGVVRSMSRGLYNDGGKNWDYPTFAIQSDIIFDGSKGGK